MSAHISNLVGIELGEPDYAMRTHGHSLGITLGGRYRELGERAGHTHSTNGIRGLIRVPEEALPRREIYSLTREREAKHSDLAARGINFADPSPSSKPQ